MGYPKISVVMSTYNEPLKWIAESIESILNQTFKDFEFIIINDNPKREELGKFLENYQKKDKRIILIKNTKNIGLTKSLNKGLKKAKGKYIARMDADDISLPKRFEKQFEFLENNKNIFLIGTGAINIDENGNESTKFNPLCSSEKIKQKLLKKNCLYHPTIMFRNEPGVDYREKMYYIEDYDLYLRLITKGKSVSNIFYKLLYYRLRENSICKGNAGKQKLMQEKAKEFYHQRIKYGKDEYESFDPNEILNIDIEKTTNKIVLKQEIFASFKLNNFKRTRKFCKKYFKSYGIFNKLLIYYFASSLGKRNINLLRKTIFN